MTLLLLRKIRGAQPLRLALASSSHAGLKGISPSTFLPPQNTPLCSPARPPLQQPARRLTGLRCSSPPALGARDHSKEEVTCATSGVRKEFVNVALTRGISLGRFLFSSSLEPRCSQPCLSCSPHQARSESRRTVFPS